MNLKDVRSKLERIKGEKDHIIKTISNNELEIRRRTRELTQYEEARDIVRVVAQITQTQLEYKISELASLPISSIFSQPYKFLAEFVLKRNKVETNLLVEDLDGNRFSPLNANGGGLVDVISFGLRLTMWTIKKPRPRPIIILDEPFRFLSRDLQQKAGELLKELSKRFEIQFIIVSHDTALIECADKVFKIEKIKGRSEVSCL